MRTSMLPAIELIRVRGTKLQGIEGNDTLLCSNAAGLIELDFPTLPRQQVDPAASAARTLTTKIHRAGLVTCDIRDYGAIGDGTMMCTSAVLRAVEDCRRRGQNGSRHVTVLFGSDSAAQQPTEYLLGGLAMAGLNNFSIVLEAGAVLLGSPHDSDYAGMPPACGAALVCIQGARDFALVGDGVVDGQGLSWYARTPVVNGPVQVLVLGGSSVLIQGLTFRNSGGFHLSLQNISGLRCQDLVVTAPMSSANTDGIDPMNCRDVVIRNVTVATGMCCKDPMPVMFVSRALINFTRLCSPPVICTPSCCLCRRRRHCAKGRNPQCAHRKL